MFYCKLYLFNNKLVVNLLLTYSHLSASTLRGVPDHDMPVSSVLCHLGRHLASGHVVFHQVSPSQLWYASISLSICRTAVPQGCSTKGLPPGARQFPAKSVSRQTGAYKRGTKDRGEGRGIVWGLNVGADV